MSFSIQHARLFLFCLPVAALAQTTGISTDWEVRKTIENLAKQASGLQPIVDRIKPEEWVGKGASDTYTMQWKTARIEVKYLVDSSAALERQPERLSAALDTYFRLEALESTLNSLKDGARRYQDDGVANALETAMAQNFSNRDKLRQHISDLAAVQEQQFQVMDREAQRCRGSLSRPCAATTPHKKREKK